MSCGIAWRLPTKPKLKTRRARLSFRRFLMSCRCREIMANENLLPEELAKAARTLEERFQMLRVPARNIASEEWNTVPTNIRRHIPPWIEALLSQFALAEGVLEYRDHRNSYQRQFSLCKPDEFAHELRGAE